MLKISELIQDQDIDIILQLGYNIMNTNKFSLKSKIWVKDILETISAITLVSQSGIPLKFIF